MLKAIPTCPKCGGDARANEGERGANEGVGETYTCKFCGTTSVLEPPAPPAPVVHQTIVHQEVIQRVVMVDPTSGKTSLECPRCSVPLFEGKAADDILHGCGTCGGVWLDNAASSRVVNTVRPALMSMSDRAARVGVGKSIDVTKPARCPFDQKDLERVTVKGVELDVCKVHGTWFDAGEIRRVGNAFQSARLSAVGGATHDYGPAAKEAERNQRYAQGAMSILAGILSTSSSR